MKYTLETASPMCSLEDFATKHNLEMVVTERSALRKHRFMAAFRHVEVKEGACLGSHYGEGKSPEAAIADYARQIIGARLVYDATGNNRREIVAPNEWASV